MAWVSPSTAVANTFITAAWANEIRDNLLQTAPAKATAAGQIFHATAANAIAALNAVAYRMPRSNAAANAMEYVAGLNLAQAPVFASATTVNSAASATDIVTQSFTTHGGLVIALGVGAISELKSAAGAPRHTFGLYRDATLLRARRAWGGAHAAVVIEWPAPIFWMETPAAATYTYRIKGQYDNVVAPTGTPTADAELLLLELAP